MQINNNVTKNDNLFRLSYSSLSQFYSCPTKFAINKLSDCPVNSYRNSAASLIGVAIHESFQYYLIYGNAEDAIKVLILKYPMKLKKAMTGAYHFLSAYKLLTELINWYENSDYQLLYINDKPAIEYKIETNFVIKNWINPLTNEPYVFNYIGFIDAIFQNKFTNELVICDIKSTSTTKDVEEDIIKYSLSPQTVEYVSNFLAVLGYTQEETKKAISSVEVMYLIARFQPSSEYEVAPISFTKTEADLTNLDNGIRFLLETIKKNGDDITKYYKSGNCKNFGNTCDYFEHCSDINKLNTIKLLSPKDDEVSIKEQTKKDSKQYYQHTIITKEIEL